MRKYKSPFKKANTHINLAIELGAKAAKKRAGPIPAFDFRLNKIIANRSIAFNPYGEASTVDILKHWHIGWSLGQKSKV